MKSFHAQAQKFSDTEWVPAGTLFEYVGDKMAATPIEFEPDTRFLSEEEANEVFRDYYVSRGYTENSKERI